MSNYGVRDGHNVPVAALGEKRMVRRRRCAVVLTAIVLAPCALATLGVERDSCEGANIGKKFAAQVGHQPGQSARG